nr:hypothetical protein [Tanacetum cinerariifolium]
MNMNANDEYENLSDHDDATDLWFMTKAIEMHGLTQQEGYYLADGIYPQCATGLSNHIRLHEKENMGFLNGDKKVQEMMSNELSMFSKDVEELYNNRDIVQLDTSVSTISQEYLLEFTSEYDISEDMHPELPVQRKGSWIFQKASHRCGQNMDLFNLIRALNPTKVKAGTHPCVAHEVPLLTVTASRVIEMEDSAVETDSPGVPSTIERSPLDFSNENPSQQSTGEAGLVEEIAALGPRVIKERRKRSNDGSTVGGKSIASMGLGTRSIFPVPTSQEMPVDVSDSDPLSFANPQYANISYSFVLNSDLLRERLSLEIRNRRIPPLPPWSGHLKAYISQAQVARQDQRIQARENEIKNLEALLEAETDMKKATEAKNAELGNELKNICALFSDLQVSNDRLSQQRCAEMDARLDALSIEFDEELYPHMLTTIAGRRWVIGHGLRLVVMKCGESTKLRQVFVDIVSARIAKGMSEGHKYEVEHEKANLDLEAIEAYGPVVDTKYVASLHALRDLKCHCGQRESCREENEMSGGVLGSAHHARSDGVSVSVPTVASQGLAILLTDAAIQTETSDDGASPAMYNLD